ncbi:hypothetical protein PENSPDRAFT_756354 [Peniophora sp. CONT]|nr:hypothetical protein PENSPDRAFT_756354 [Peniophora sp. CONT]
MESRTTNTAQRVIIPPFWLLTLDATIAIVNFIAPLVGQLAWFTALFAAVAAPLDLNTKAVSTFEIRLAGVLLSVPTGVLVARVVGHWFLEGVVAPELGYWRMRWLDEDGARWLAEQKASAEAASTETSSSTVRTPSSQSTVLEVAHSTDGTDGPLSPTDSIHDLSPFEEMQRQDLIRRWQAGL